MKQYKIIIFLIGTAGLIALTSLHLSTKQRQNSNLRNSSGIVSPASGLSGDVNCELPVPDVNKRDTHRLEMMQALQINSTLESAGKGSKHDPASRWD